MVALLVVVECDVLLDLVGVFLVVMTRFETLVLAP